MLKSNKKLTVICILEILKNYSDENNPLTHADIVKKLYNIYNVDCERKSIGMSIDSLIDFGYDIIKLERGGCYLGEREFEDYEIAYLMDAVFSSRNISFIHTQDLLKKLASFLSENKRKRFSRHIYKADNIPRTINKDFFYNIDVINEAVDKGKKVEFQYNRYDAFNTLKPRRTQPYIVSPYFMHNNNAWYYLVCDDGRGELVNYRLDYITEIQLSKNDITPVTAIKGCEKGLDIPKYINEHVYMFSGDVVNVVLRLTDERAISNLFDWYGQNARVEIKEEKILAYITVSERAVVYWALQYGESVEIVSPSSARLTLQEKIKTISEKYKI